MPDGFTATVDATGIIDLFDRMGPSMDFLAREVGRDTARRIVDEAKARLARETHGTGKTASEIHFELSNDGGGYVVLAYTAGAQRAPVDLYLEYGTSKMFARSFFWAAVELEEGPHLQRLTAAMEAWLAEVGR